MNALDESIRSIVRGVVREEIRAALDEQRGRTPTRNAEDGYLSIASAASFADVAAGTLRRWIREGRLPAVRAGRVFRVSRAELVGFLARAGRSAEVTERARSFVTKRA